MGNGTNSDGRIGTIQCSCSSCWPTLSDGSPNTSPGYDHATGRLIKPGNSPYETEYFKTMMAYQKDAAETPPKDYAEQTVVKDQEQPEPLLQLFACDHLPPHLKEVSILFHDVAYTIVAILPRNAQRTHALNNLVLAKDAAVRARLWNNEWNG